ncbi:MAG TPA: acetate--CoA ligase family protein, partial [Methanoregula sp.]|nr:acetate--CoA ligase family protein [Methanoregula sp.]
MTRTLLSEAEGYALLAAHKIPVPNHSLTTTPEEAARASDAIGYPVVMKIVSPQIVHKSDAGGVITGIGSADQVRAAFERIMNNARTSAPDARIAGILVEQQMPPGLELIIGGKIDPAFGRILTIGLGGKMVELLRDVSLRVLPVTDDDINDMIQELKGYPLIAGYRDEPPRDKKALAAIIRSAADLFLSDLTLSEFDINPLVLYSTGACAVDARFYREDREIPAEASSTAPLDNSLLDISSIAIVGASQDPNTIGYAICRNLLTFPGSIYPVNPRSPMVLGRQAYPDLASIPGKVDLAVIAIPATGVPGIIEEAGKKKIPLSIIISSGFREGGGEGRNLEEDMLAIAKRYNMRIMGP